MLATSTTTNEWSNLNKVLPKNVKLFEVRNDITNNIQKYLYVHIIWFSEILSTWMGRPKVKSFHGKLMNDSFTTWSQQQVLNNLRV